MECDFIKRIAAKFCDTPHHGNTVRSAKNEEVACRDAHNGRGPGRTSVRIKQHLGFINHGDIDGIMERTHLHSRRQMATAGNIDPFFTCCEGSFDTTRCQRFAEFMCKQAEWRQSETAFRLGERIESCMGFAAVCRAGDQCDATFKSTRRPEMGGVVIKSSNAGNDGIGNFLADIWSVPQRDTASPPVLSLFRILPPFR